MTSNPDDYVKSAGKAAIEASRKTPDTIDQSMEDGQWRDVQAL